MTKTYKAMLILLVLLVGSEIEAFRKNMTALMEAKQTITRVRGGAKERARAPWAGPPIYLLAPCEGKTRAAEGRPRKLLPEASREALFQESVTSFFKSPFSRKNVVKSIHLAPALTQYIESKGATRQFAMGHHQCTIGNRLPRNKKECNLTHVTPEAEQRMSEWSVAVSCEPTSVEAETEGVPALFFYVLAGKQESEENAWFKSGGFKKGKPAEDEIVKMAHAFTKMVVANL